MACVGVFRAPQQVQFRAPVGHRKRACEFNRVLQHRCQIACRPLVHRLLYGFNQGVLRRDLCSNQAIQVSC